MAKESDITTIRIPKSVKDELKDVATEKEPYHATISRLISENQQLKETNSNYAKMIRMYENQQIESVHENITEFCNKGSDEFSTYFVIMKIATDIVPSADERVDALVYNDFLTGLINDGKTDLIYKACELVKEQVKLGDSAFYNQLDIIDEYKAYVENQ